MKCERFFLEIAAKQRNSQQVYFADMSNESRGSEERGEDCAHELGFQRAAKSEDYPGADDMMMVMMVMMMIL